MKKTIFIFMIFSFVFVSCNGQNTEISEENKPKTDIKVIKEYDENGNLIKYDSSYSYFYSNIRNNSELEDSVIDQFHKHFKKNFFFSEDPFFNDFFFQDSLLDFDFYTNDFFTSRYRNNMSRMNQLFLEMDSIKNLFFMDQFKETPDD